MPQPGCALLGTHAGQAVAQNQSPAATHENFHAGELPSSAHTCSFGVRDTRQGESAEYHKVSSTQGGPGPGPPPACCRDGGRGLHQGAQLQSCTKGEGFPEFYEGRRLGHPMNTDAGQPQGKGSAATLRLYAGSGPPATRHQEAVLCDRPPPFTTPHYMHAHTHRRNKDGDCLPGSWSKWCRQALSRGVAGYSWTWGSGSMPSAR